MTAALTGEQRTALERLVQNARKWIEADLEESIEGRYGINTDGRIEPESSLTLTNAEAATRADLVDIVAFLRSEGEGEAESVARLVREAAFTHTNRLVAVRVAEAIELLPETMAKGLASSGFRDFSELAPTIATTEWGRFSVFIRLCADELAADVPALFDPRNPLLQLTMSEPVLADLIAAIVEADVDIWAAPDTLGWAYQFFNTRNDRRDARYRSDGSPKPPESSQDLAIRNQFFTPDYVVEFLVQNSLGERLSRELPSLRRDMEMLVEVSDAPGSPDLAAVSVLDPACGSGHFLIGAYEVLERAWHQLGVDAEEAAPRIVANLWGVDIDPRATQIAQAAIVFRARRRCPTAPLPVPNIVCARSLTVGPSSDQVLANSSKRIREAVVALANELDAAPVLGPLLKLEERLDRELRNVFGAGQQAGTLSESVDTRADKEDVLSALRSVADATWSSPFERLFVAEALDAVRLVEVLSRRYTCVLMNPPFGLCVPESQGYLQAAYEGWTDLFACFLERGRELLEPGGSLGILMPNTFFNTRKMRTLRETLIRERSLRLVLDLGAGVLEDAAVEVAALVIGTSNEIRYLDAVDAPHEAKPGLAADFRRQAQVSRPRDYEGGNYLLTFRREQDEDNAAKPLDPNYALVRTGGNTFDNYRFIRMWWEVPDGDPADWPPYFKGGEYFPYWVSPRLVLDWKDDGANLRELGEQRGVLPQVLQSSTHWGKAGLTYPRAGKKFGARVMQPGGIFSEKSVAILPNDEDDAPALLGLLNSSPTSSYFSEIGRGRFVENSWVKGVPIDVGAFDEVREELAELASQLIEVFASVDRLDETSPEFFEFPDPVELVRSLEDLRSQAQSRQKRLDELSERVVRRPTNPDHPTEVAAALSLLGDVDELLFRRVSFIVGRCFGRWGEQDEEMVLLQQPGSTRDLAGCVQGLLPAYGFEQALSALGLESFFGRGGIHQFFATRFFKRHLSLYSASRRKAPIYWPLQVPSKAWGVWLYAPKLARESIYAIIREAEERLRLADERISYLVRETETGGGGRKTSEISRELEAEQSLAVELESFRSEAERIAATGWQPDPDDGIIMNAAPLANLLPAWADASKCRDEIRDGKYPWATVAQFADQL